MKKIIIFGGTGFIGMSLANHLRMNGFIPILIARNKPERLNGFEFHSWSPNTLGDWINTLNDSIAVVNLVGKSVDCIKTPGNCDLILRSRVDSTKTIGQALQAVSNPPGIWIQMSTAHIYGDPPSQICTESSTTGYGLAPFVGKAWEQAFVESRPKDCRGVVLRTSFVIGKNGGALKTLSRIVKLGLGGKVGNGKQGMSWIHEFDLNEIIREAIDNESYSGIYICSSPNPVSNNEFMQSLRKALKVPIGLPTPAIITKIGAYLIFRTEPELALYGRYVKSERLEMEGFRFSFPELDNALKDLHS